VLGGVDELINKPEVLPVITGNTPVPSQYEVGSFHYGRDYFLGGMLRFNDEDLSALLTVAGSALSSATK